MNTLWPCSDMSRVCSIFIYLFFSVKYVKRTTMLICVSVYASVCLPQTDPAVTVCFFFSSYSYKYFCDD